MKHKILFILILLLAIALLLNGCGETGGGGEKHNPNPIIDAITGTITDGRSGPALSDVTVKVYVSGEYNGTSVTTGTNGKFSIPLTEIGDGNSDVDLIATKSGYAGTRYQRVNLLQFNSYVANMVMKKVFNSNWSTDPPVATIDATPEQTVTGTVKVNVSLTGGEDPTNSSVALAVGQEAFWLAPVPGSYPFEFDLDSTGMPNGPNSCYIIAYDLNNNCVINWIPVTISNDVPTGPSLIMTNPINIAAITLGEDMQASQLSQMKFSEAQRAFKNWDSQRSSVHIESATINSSCFIQLSWEPEFYQSQFKGYKIYRASRASGPWTSVGYADYDPEYSQFYIIDHSPQITPNVAFYYKVVPVNANGVEGKGQTGSVIPLGRYEVNLASPVNDATGVSLNPVFRWSKNLSTATSYYYKLEVSSLSTAEYASCEFFTTSAQNSLAYSQSDWDAYFNLKNNQEYQWDIIDARAYKQYSYYSMAVSFAAKGQYAAGSHNGAFVFTTAAQ